MSWTYAQSTGTLAHDGKVEGIGYSGRGVCKNMPDTQAVHGEGPLPRGTYCMAEWIAKDSRLGLGLIRLAPAMDNRMFGRSGFYIHGDNPAHPGESSDGCIVYGHIIDRYAIWTSQDHDLEVIE